MSSDGNVQVVARFRPPNSIEKKHGEDKNVVEFEPSGKALKLNVKAHAKGPAGQKRFVFDSIFSPDMGQSAMFDTSIRPMCADLMAGFNCTVFAYGQTGSGKTFSMMGVPTDDKLKGVIPRLTESVFDHIDKDSGNTEYTIKVSYVEIYMEQIQDLLDTNKSNLKVRESSHGVWIEDVTDVYVSSPDDVYEVMRNGGLNRSVSATQMNAESSRSHSVFILTVGQIDRDTNSKRGAKLTLVDLAGSEKVQKSGASGSTLNEAKHINKSLSALGNVINALTTGQGHVPYRDSKLTRLLSDSLGGNSKTCLIVTCSPCQYNMDETLSTLRFGTRAKAIKNKAKANVELSVAEYQRLLGQAQATITAQADVITKYEAQLTELLGDAFTPLSVALAKRRRASVTSFGQTMQVDIAAAAGGDDAADDGSKNAASAGAGAGEDADDSKTTSDDVDDGTAAEGAVGAVTAAGTAANEPTGETATATATTSTAETTTTTAAAAAEPAYDLSSAELSLLASTLGEADGSGESSSSSSSSSSAAAVPSATPSWLVDLSDAASLLGTMVDDAASSGSDAGAVTATTDKGDSVALTASSVQWLSDLATQMEEALAADRERTSRAAAAAASAAKAAASAAASATQAGADGSYDSGGADVDGGSRRSNVNRGHRRGDSEQDDEQSQRRQDGEDNGEEEEVKELDTTLGIRMVPGTGKVSRTEYERILTLLQTKVERYVELQIRGRRRDDELDRLQHEYESTFLKTDLQRELYTKNRELEQKLEASQQLTQKLFASDLYLRKRLAQRVTGGGDNEGGELITDEDDPMAEGSGGSGGAGVAGGSGGGKSKSNWKSKLKSKFNNKFGNSGAASSSGGSPKKNKINMGGGSVSKQKMDFFF